jgi:hypothetical protein
MICLAFPLLLFIYFMRMRLLDTHHPSTKLHWSIGWRLYAALVDSKTRLTVGAQSIAPAQSIAHGQIGDSISQKN